MRWAQTLVVASFLCGMPFSIVSAAQVFLNTEESIRGTQDTFYVPIRIDTQGECINAVRVVLGYNPDLISVRDISTGDSILSLWTTMPQIERLEGKEIGRVVLEGGVPGGYCGRVLGDPGLTNILAKLVVTGVSRLENTEESTTTQIVVDPETTAYLHDGRGTEAELTVLGVTLLLTQSTTTPQNVWLSDVKNDTIAPELFDIILVEGPSVGNNKHYIVFNALDKQSGIDHYEVLETDPDRFGFLTWVPKEAYWVEAQSPYVLRDQKLRSKIMVKAVDKNGNERIVTYTPPMSALTELTSTSGFLSILAVLVLIGILVFFTVLMRRRTKMEKKKGEEVFPPEHHEM